MRRTILAALAAAALFVGVGLAVAPQAQATTNFDIWETNAQWAVGTPNGDGGGNPVKEVAHPGKLVYFQQVGCCTNGDPWGYLRLVSNDNFIAATSVGCDVTIKTSASSDGTVWFAVTPNNDEKFDNRYCGGGGEGAHMGGPNNGGQFEICQGTGCTGWYTNMTLHQP